MSTIQGYRSSNQCHCRNCGKHYNENKSRADYKGYCSMACQHDKAWRLGYRKPKPVWKTVPSEYDVLSKANAIGSVYVKDI